MGSCNSRSHGSIEFEDVFNLKMDRATRKASIEKVVPCVHHGRL